MKQTKIGKAIKKYDAQAFSVEIIEEVDSIENLNDREKFWIAELDTIQNGYNIAKGGNGGTGRKKGSLSNHEIQNLRNRMIRNNPMKIIRINSGTFKKGNKPTITAERNEKIRISKIGIKNPNSRSFLIVRPDGSVEKTECLAEFCRNNNLSIMCMKQVARGKNKTHRGFSIKPRHF